MNSTVIGPQSAFEVVVKILLISQIYVCAGSLRVYSASAKYSSFRVSSALGHGSTNVIVKRAESEIDPTYPDISNS